MRPAARRRTAAAAALASFLLGAGAAQAHLLPAQQGTVNVVGAGIFTALSVPASAFPGADDDHDGRIDVQELERHEADLRAEIDRRLAVRDGEVRARTVRIDLIPSPSHDAASEDQIVVLSHAELDAPPRDLHVRFDLFGARASGRSLTLTATRHPESGTETQVGVLTPEAPDLALFAPPAAPPPALPRALGRAPGGLLPGALAAAASLLAMAIWSRAKRSVTQSP